MTALRLAYQDLRAPVAQAAPHQLEQVDCLLLDGGALAAGRDAAPGEQLGQALRALGPSLYLDAQIRLLASLAGRDPGGAVAAAAAALVTTGNAELPVAVVRGQDVLDRLEELLLHADLAHAETGQRFVELNAKTVAAVASLGPRPAAQAMRQGARLVMVAHEDPGVLAEAAAWVAAAKRGGSPARRAGQTLAECYPQLIGDALTRAGWTQDQTLQAELGPDGGVTFHGEPGLAASAQQRPAKPPREPDADRTDLTLVYLEGYAAQLVLATPNPHARGRLENLLANAPAEVRDCLARADPLGDEAVVELPLFHARREKVVLAAGRLSGVLDLAAGVIGIQRLGGPPIVRPVYASWPTSLPNELLEWSVDIKPAHQWLD